MVSFQFAGGPIDDPVEAHNAFAAYGRAAAAWARVETHLDAVLISVNKKTHSPELFGEHPVSFDRKIELLKRWFNKHPALFAHQEDIRVLTSKLKELSKRARNYYFHSILEEYDSEAKALKFKNLRMEGNELHVRFISLNEEQLTVFTDLVNMTNAYLGTISRQIFTLDGISHLRAPQSPHSPQDQ